MIEKTEAILNELYDSINECDWDYWEEVEEEIHRMYDSCYIIYINVLEKTCIDDIYSSAQYFSSKKNRKCLLVSKRKFDKFKEYMNDLLRSGYKDEANDIIETLNKRYTDFNFFDLCNTKESELQRACLKYFKIHFPNLLIFPISNVEEDDIITASIIERNGVVESIPYLFIAEPCGKYLGMFIELKVGDKNPTNHQNKIIDMLRETGYCVEDCRSVDEFLYKVDYYITEQL
jgi:hypothetical protein